MPRVQVQKHKKPFKVSHLEVNLHVIITMLSLARKSSRGQALDGVEEGNFSTLLLQRA